jgi:hypothetical protein
MPGTGWSAPIADEHAGEVLRWYEGLETQVVDFMRVVPPHGTNLGVWSSKIATVLVEACCLIESIFYQFRDDAAIKQGKPLPKAKPGKRIFLTLKDYADLYSSLLRLPERTAILLTDTWEFRTPFILWRDLLGGAPFDGKKHVPEWWDLYNSSKHDRITVFPEFTLTRAIDALAGALVVISTIPAFAPALMRHKWLPLNNWNPEYLMEEYQHALSQASSDKQFAIETRLFTLLIGGRPLPDNINDFRPSIHGVTPRLLRHFGKF